ncbi:hypothetical protein [Nocardioides sp. Arc9.136]|uniref:hypothetical protein n=1 Tax=Nocardioides sp. Arc9.136 TaxID=2996826 RepID=UPI002666D8D9|nr:hypothetical protein [Nocardioides sp. Arc9.136]WKN49255.1 hypothetical protein OSR43_03790 [Nocardioides sp. Arc9.136]
MSDHGTGDPETPAPPGTPLREDEPAAPTGASREPRGEVDESHLEEPVAGSEADHRHGDRPE